jgi:hypothetical protein
MFIIGIPRETFAIKKQADKQHFRREQFENGN